MRNRFRVSSASRTVGDADRTIEAWVRFEGTYGTWATGLIEGLFVGYGMWETLSETNELLVSAGTSAVPDTLQYSQWGAGISAPTTSQPGTWNHFAFTLASGTATLYVNGTAVASSSSLTVNTPSEGSTTYIGGEPSPPDEDPEWLTGEVDEVSIYTRALDPSEIALIFPAGSAGKCNSQ
jgi:hypothetical protein